MVPFHRSSLKAALLGLGVAVLLAGCATRSVDDRLARDKPVTKPSTCVQSTASRIPQKTECANAPGRTYSKEELERTGGATLEEKLRVLDPSVSIPR